MDIDQLLQKIAEAMDKTGEPIDGGCAMADVAEMILTAKRIADKPFCVVTEWQIWNIPYGHSALSELKSHGLKPAVLYAKKVIEDERGRWGPEAQVRTTMLVSMHRECIFESTNSMYILVGPGLKKSVDQLVVVRSRFE